VVRYAPGAVIVRFEEGARPDSLEVTIVREIVRAREEIATQFVPNLYIFRGMEHGGSVSHPQWEVDGGVINAAKALSTSCEP
jgi:hypothetical protein